MRDEKIARRCGAKHILKSKVAQHHMFSEVEMWKIVHVVVAQSALSSQNAKSAPASDIFEPVLEVEMSKKCTRLWLEAHLEVNMWKKRGWDHSCSRSPSVEKVHAAAAPSTIGSEHVTKKK